MDNASVTRESVLEQLDRVLGSTAFRGAERSTAMLRYVVGRALENDTNRLKEYTLGVEALGRGEGFDPRTDPIVRAEASRLRTRLDRYYGSEGRRDRIQIVLPKGSYAPQFVDRKEQPTTDPTDGAAGDGAVATASDTGVGVRAADARMGVPRALAWLAAVTTVLGLFAVGLWLGGRRASAPQPFQQFDIDLASDGALGSEVGTDIAISRDGTRLAFVSVGRDGLPRLYTRLLSEAAATQLPGTESVRGPFFSPDGRWIGFWSAGKLKKIAVDGGSPVTLCDATDLLGASWSEDGSIIATLNSTGTLWRVSAAGGTPTRVVDLSAESISPRWAQVLPGGTHVLFTAVRGAASDQANIEVLSLRDGSRKVVVRGGTFGRLLAPALLAYVNQGALYAQPFDVRRLETTGPAAPVLDGIAYSPTFGYAQLDVSATGTAIYRKALGGGRFVAAWLDSTGATTPLIDVPGRYMAPALSPDGRRLTMTVMDGGVPTVAFWDLAAGRARRSATGPPVQSIAAWAPGGRHVLLADDRGILWASDSGGAPSTLVSTGGVAVPWSFSPDERHVAFHQMDPETAFDLWTVPIESDSGGLRAGMPVAFLRTRAFEVYPSFSPDGRWVVYTSNESGTWEVYSRHFPDDGTKVQVSKGGGRVPRWSRSGRELFYATDDQRLMVVRYDPRTASFASTPRQWSAVRLADTGVLPNFDLAPSEGRVLALLPAAPPSGRRENHATILLGFFTDVQRRLERR
jgi:serine/threonine-protein kinase